MIPAPRLRIDGLTHRTEQTQAMAARAPHIIIAFTHQRTWRRWCCEERMDLMAVDHFPDTAGCRPVRHALKHQRCRAVGKRPIDNIAMASDPAHIGRTPVNLAPSVIKAPFMRQARPEQIPPRCMGRSEEHTSELQSPI